VSLLIDEDVSGFDVTMDNTRLVDVGKCDKEFADGDDGVSLLDDIGFGSFHERTHAALERGLITSSSDPVTVLFSITPYIIRLNSAHEL
jgi:hypothetical protein